MNDKKKTIIELFKIFFEIGAFTFGGGYAMIPLLQKEIVENKGWIDEDEMLDLVVVAESTPGVIAVNFATFTGYKLAGVLGAAVATFGVVIPSFIIIILISLFFSSFRNIEIVKYVFKGIQSGIIILIFGAGFKLSKELDKNIFNIFGVITAFVLVFVLKISAVYVLMISAFLGMFYNLFLNKNKKGDK